MERPTAVLRRLLVLESMHEFIAKEITALKQQMQNNDLKVLERKMNLHDIWIQYRHDTHHDEAIFMKKMLDAETKSRLRKTGIIA